MFGWLKSKSDLFVILGILAFSMLGATAAAKADKITVNIQTDTFGGETHWSIATNPGAVTLDKRDPGFYATVTNYMTESIELPTGDYTFTMFDTFGDGGAVWSIDVPGTGNIPSAGTGYGFSESVLFSIAPTDPPVLSEVTPVASPSNVTTPQYTFNSSEAGPITYGGACSSATTNAVAGNNTITFNELPSGIYSNCTISVTGAAPDPSLPLAVSAFTIDTNNPSVIISSGPSSFAGVNAFTVTVQFSEIVTGFNSASDVTVVNGTASTPVSAGSGAYTVTITPSGAGNVSIDILAGVAIDASGNGNNAADTLVIENTIVEDTQKVIASYVGSRMRNLLNLQPNIVGFLDGSFSSSGGVPASFGLEIGDNNLKSLFFTSLGQIWAEADRNEKIAIDGNVEQSLSKSSTRAAVSSSNDRSKSQTREKTYGSNAGLDSTNALSAAQLRGYDIWVQLYGAKSEAGSAESTLGVAYVGGHYFVNSNLLIGAMVQADWAMEENDTINSSARGFGWMVGPYLAAKLPEHNLFFNARASWGKSNNDVSPIGTYKDEFDTERWLVSAGLSGKFDVNGWTISPSVNVSYFEEKQKAYTDSLNNFIPGQTFSQGEVRFGPSFSYDIKLDQKVIVRPKIGFSGVWNFDIENGVNSQGAVIGIDDVRGRLSAGLTAFSASDWSLNIEGFYDGIGVDNYNAYGGKIRLVIPFQ